jgi:hypothetical protein
VIVELRNIQKLAKSFREGKVPEGQLAAAFESFRRAFSAFWEKDGAELIGQTASIGLIVAGTLLFEHVGMPEGVAQMRGPGES